MMAIPPKEPFAEAARKAIEDHSEWDSPHCFMTLHWDGKKLTCLTYATIMPDVEPDDYPRIMRGVADGAIRDHPGDAPYAYLLQVEAHGVIEPGPDASQAERDQFRADHLTRSFHKRPDAHEAAFAWCADIHGRLWEASKRRDLPGIRERFYPPGMAPAGTAIQALLAVARATGIRAHGLPGPAAPWN